MTWMPTVSGRAVDLVLPVREQVDFSDIAWALAHENRYHGNGQVPVSVAHHTLIGLDICPERLRPYWLLHDAHEARIGDLANPVREALAAVADAELAEGAGSTIRAALQILKRRHDEVIHAAAGLKMPSKAQREEIAAIDARCLVLEFCTFHRPSERPRRFQREGVPEERTTRRFMAPDKMAPHPATRFRYYRRPLRDPDAATGRRPLPCCAQGADRRHGGRMSKSHAHTLKKTKRKLKKINAYLLRRELERRGEPYATIACACHGRKGIDFGAADTAKHCLSQGDLREAAIWIARAYPDFGRLEQLIARALPATEG